MFCAHCGNQNRNGARFCTLCGAALGPGAEVSRASPPARAAPPQGMRRRSAPALMLALLLFAFAVSQMALKVAGATAPGLVTGYEQRIYVGQQDDTRDPTRYEMFYEFTAADGGIYTGSVTKSFPRGIRAPSDGASQTVTIRYVPMLPHINAPDSETTLLPGVLLLGLSALLFALGLRGRVRIG